MTQDQIDSNSFQAGRDFQQEYCKRELHDNLAQELLGLQMLLRAFEKRINPVKLDPFWLKIISQADRAVNCLDGIVNNYIPSHLVGLTLEEAIVETFKFETTDLLLVEGSSGIIIKSDNFAIQLLRVLQEFVSNTIKHGKASQVVITFRRLTASSLITLIDNGIGFDIESIVQGNGLNNIAFRLESIGAHYIYESTPHSGTQLKITLHDTLN